MLYMTITYIIVNVTTSQDLKKFIESFGTDNII